MRIKFLKLQNWLFGVLLGALGLGGCHSAKRAAEAVPTNADEPDPVPAADTIAKPKPRSRNDIVLMYGVPTVDFTVRGKVLSPKGQPVPNAEVMILDDGIEATPDTIYGDPAYIERYSRRAAVRTDTEGRFEAHASMMPRKNMQVLVRDVDGPENGSYRHKVVDIPTDDKDIDRSKASGWKIGEANTEVEIKLEESTK